MKFLKLFSLKIIKPKKYSGAFASIFKILRKKFKAFSKLVYLEIEESVCTKETIGSLEIPWIKNSLDP